MSFVGAQRIDVRSADGTAIACFVSGDGPPLVLVHGTAADHTTFRVVEPLLRGSFTCWSVDRRGRGASGDAEGYSIVREYEDLAAVADAASGAAGSPSPVTVVGHSYGGRCALGAALRSRSIARLVVYEGAPGEDPVAAADLEMRLADLDAAGRPADVLRLFMREVVGMTPDELAGYEASAVWPARVAAAGTIVRELRSAVADPAASLAALASVAQPVLLLAGGESRATFRDATIALASRLRDARVVVLASQKHAAHHTDPERFVAEVAAFAASPSLARSAPSAGSAASVTPGRPATTGPS